jgi:hypothetical protein
MGVIEALGYSGRHERASKWVLEGCPAWGFRGELTGEVRGERVSQQVGTASLAKN